MWIGALPSWKKKRGGGGGGGGEEITHQSLTLMRTDLLFLKKLTIWNISGDPEKDIFLDSETFKKIEKGRMKRL